MSTEQQYENLRGLDEISHVRSVMGLRMYAVTESSLGFWSHSDSRCFSGWVRNQHTFSPFAESG